jgi:DNA-binding HxlR family transcriptional regulator
MSDRADTLDVIGDWWSLLILRRIDRGTQQLRTRPFE